MDNAHGRLYAGAPVFGPGPMLDSARRGGTGPLPKKTIQCALCCPNVYTSCGWAMGEKRPKSFEQCQLNSHTWQEITPGAVARPLLAKIPLIT